ASFTTEASRWAHNSWTMRCDGFLLVGRWHERRRGSRWAYACEILLLQLQRPLQHHLHLGSGRDIHVGIAREQRNHTHRGQACAKPGQPALKRMTCFGPSNCARTSAHWYRDFGRFACIPAFTAVLLDGSLPVVLYGLVLCSRDTIHNPGDFHHRTVGENDRRKVHVELRF